MTEQQRDRTLLDSRLDAETAASSQASARPVQHTSSSSCSPSSLSCSASSVSPGSVSSDAPGNSALKDEGADASGVRPAKRVRVSSRCVDSVESPSLEEEEREKASGEASGDSTTDTETRIRKEEEAKSVAERQKRLYSSFLPPGLLNDFVSAALALDASGDSPAEPGCTYTPDSGPPGGSPVSRHLGAPRDPQTPCEALLSFDRESLLTFASLFHLLVSGRGTDEGELQEAAQADKREAEEAAQQTELEGDVSTRGCWGREVGARVQPEVTKKTRKSSASEEVVEGTSSGDRTRKKALEMSSSPLVFLRGRRSREVLVRRLLRQLRGDDGEGQNSGAASSGGRASLSSAVHPPQAVLFEAWMKALKIFLSFVTSSALVGSHAKALALVAVFDILLLLLSPEEDLSPSSASFSSASSAGASTGKVVDGAGKAADAASKGRRREGASRPVLDFNNFADLLVEFARTVPLREIGSVISFLEKNKESLIAAFQRKGRDCLSGSKQLDTAQAKRALQAAGAKVIGMVKSIEEPLMHANEKQYIFALRRLLMETLSMTHAGLSNRTMQRAEATPVVLDSLEAWNALSHFGVGVESPSASTHADRSRSKKSSGKSTQQAGSGGKEAAPRSAKSLENERKSEKGGGDSLSSFGACSYAVYAAYGKALAFLQAPDRVLEQPAEVVTDVLSSLDTVLSYFEKHPAVSTRAAAETRSPAVSLDRTLDQDEAEVKRACDNLLLLSSSGNPHYLSAGAFRERIDNSFFRRELLTSACVAFHFLGQAVGLGGQEKRGKTEEQSSQGKAAKKETPVRPAGGGETGATAQRMQQKIRETYSALNEKTKATLASLETRVWSLAAALFNSSSPSAHVSPFSELSTTLSSSQLSLRGSESLSAPCRQTARRNVDRARSLASDVEEERSGIEKLLQTEQLWLWWKNRNCFDSVLKPSGSDSLSFSAADVPAPALLPFAVQAALSSSNLAKTLEKQAHEETRKKSETEKSPEQPAQPEPAKNAQKLASSQSASSQSASGEEAKAKEVQLALQESKERSDEKSEKSESKADTMDRGGAEEAQTGEKEEAEPDKLLSRALALAKQAEMGENSWWPELHRGSKPRKDSVVMRRLVQWLHAWEAAEGSSAASSPSVSSGLSSEQEGGEPLAGRVGLAIPGPLRLLRQGEAWFTSDSRNLPSDYDDLLFMDKLRVKLNDLVQKMDDDDNPENDVDEEERSKHNAVFSLRLRKLFALFYGDAYVAMPYKETKCEDLRQAIAEYDTKGLAARLGLKAVEKRSVSQATNEQGAEQES
ncbi:hypothetical protein TGRUB_288040 [Toxoplasma gondii RUB]|uniref:Uncharacterized protein n=3 Tax=Toxoplasma gondii TaxID=5811 RepID=A0A086M0V8_TOXGO|nr:hypothetical protein TGRUB_288040 [Toxoplasma gondii RUB]